MTIISHVRRATIPEISAELDRRGAVIENIEEERDAVSDKINAIRKVRDGYADQARFADIDCAVHFREFVRRIDAALTTNSREAA
jgi:hypothetical protein